MQEKGQYAYEVAKQSKHLYTLLRTFSTSPIMYATVSLDSVLKALSLLRQYIGKFIYSAIDILQKIVFYAWRINQEK